MNVNKVILGGRLTADVEMRTTQNDMNVGRFTVAVNRHTKEKTTDFVNFVAFGKTANFISKYFKKGQQIFIVGELHVDSFEQNGEKRKSVNVVVNEVDFVGDKIKESEEDKPSASVSAEDFEDELPF